MKKLLALICIVVIFGSLTTAVAVESTNSNNAISAIELATVQANMEARGLWDSNFVVDFLYDANDVPMFLLGVTDKGYIILERET